MGDTEQRRRAQWRPGEAIKSGRFMGNNLALRAPRGNRAAPTTGTRRRRRRITFDVRRDRWMKLEAALEVRRFSEFLQRKY
jgi:hypothetical protein